MYHEYPLVKNLERTTLFIDQQCQETICRQLFYIHKYNRVHMTQQKLKAKISISVFQLSVNSSKIVQRMQNILASGQNLTSINLMTPWSIVSLKWSLLDQLSCLLELLKLESLPVQAWHPFIAFPDTKRLFFNPAAGPAFSHSLAGCLSALCQSSPAPILDHGDDEPRLHEYPAYAAIDSEQGTRKYSTQYL